MAKCKILFISMLMLFTFISQVHAYVDPGVTGLIFQFGYAIILGIIAWFAGFGAVFKRLYKKLFRKENEKHDSGDDINLTENEDA